MNATRHLRRENDVRFVLVVIIIAVAGCASPIYWTTLMSKPEDGYPALRFVEPVRFAGLDGVVWEFKAGSVLVGDRTRDIDGQLLYCGIMVDGEQPRGCVIKRGGSSSSRAAPRDGRCRGEKKRVRHTAGLCRGGSVSLRCKEGNLRHLVCFGMVILAVAGCSSTTLVTKPAGGYPALRFTQTVRLVGLLGNSWEFQAGTTLVGDRTRDSDKQLLYYGPMVVGPMTIPETIVGETHEVGALKQGSKLVIFGALSSDKVASIEAEPEISPGAIEEVSLGGST